MSNLNNSNNINKNRYVIYPIQDHDVWDMYLKALSSFWLPSEVSLDNDKYNFENLDKNTQYFIKHVLAFFAASDGIVIENLASNMMNKFDELEIKSFYGFQIAMENIHSVMYSTLIDVYITDQNEKESLFNSIQNIPTIKKKAEWAIKWINFNKANENILNVINDENIEESTKELLRSKIPKDYNEDTVKATLLAAFACVEGIFFAGSFCAIYWLRSKNNPLRGLSISNDFISRDEGLHTEFACLLYRKYIKHKLSEDVVFTIVREAVNIEDEFINSALPCKLLGMNSEMMQQYIRYIADRLLVSLGYEKLFGIKEQPFDFMNRLNIPNKTNFFEEKPSEYSKFIGNDNNVTNSHNIYYYNDLKMQNKF